MRHFASPRDWKPRSACSRIARTAERLGPGGRLRRTAPWLACIAAVAGPAGLSGDLPDARADAEPTGRLNLIVISIDTLRSDRLGSYGYARDTSPRLDAFARRGAVYENAVAESGWTLPSHVSMLSGLYPSTHGVVDPAVKPNRRTALLAELLRGAGYRTLGFTDGGYVGTEYGFDRGFESFDDSDGELQATLSQALQRIGVLAGGERYFLFVHTYDVHCPYAPSKGYAGRFQSEGAQFIETRGRCGNPHFNGMSLAEGQVRFLSDRYDDSIREADAALGGFFEQLEKSGALADTVVVITSDHGEEFEEHGQIGHERTLYREALAIPLIIVAPGVAPARIAAPAGLVDIAPTVLTLLGVPVPEDMEGGSLVSPPGGGAAKVRAGARVSELSWQVRLRSVMTPELHLILDLDSERAQLFEPRADPREARDVAGRRPQELKELRGVLDRYASERRPRKPATLDEVPDELTEQLRALGYVE
jgi:arylsulfatase A-like enzyme